MASLSSISPHVIVSQARSLTLRYHIATVGSNLQYREKFRVRYQLSNCQLLFPAPNLLSIFFPKSIAICVLWGAQPIV